ncbi:MAG: ubiquinone biosynthesis protein UbiB, partial [Pseudomonadota bacterium]
ASRSAIEISLAQLFAYTDVFDMETRTELILLQKSMVVAEGVARELDPNINMWTAAEPIAEEWIARNYGVAGQIRTAGESASLLGRVLADAPRVLQHAERATVAFADMTRDGVRLDDATLKKMSGAQSRGARWQAAAIWIAAGALVVIAWQLLTG